MRQYIVNLTNNLIGKRNYDELWDKCQNNEKFIAHCQMDLYCGDVLTMNPETLGKIMASFEIGDVMASQKELLHELHFSGDCEDVLRELTARCLAYAIMQRLEPAHLRLPDVPPWRNRK